MASTTTTFLFLEKMRLMMEDLESMCRKSDSELQKELEVAFSSEPEKVGDIRYDQLEYVNTEDIPVLYRIEKIVGALEFIGNIVEWDELGYALREPINRIEEMGRSIYPAIVTFFELENKKIETLEQNITIDRFYPL